MKSLKQLCNDTQLSFNLVNEASSVVKSFAKKTGKSEVEVEKLWSKAKSIADEEGEKDNFAFITGILKKMLKINEYYDLKEKTSNENFILVDGNFMTLEIKEHPNNSFMRLKVDGDKALTSIKSVNYIKDQFSETEWNDIDNIFKKKYDEVASDLEKSIKKFESDVNKSIKNLEKFNKTFK